MDIGSQNRGFRSALLALFAASVFFVVNIHGAFAQSGEAAIAEKYVQWAEAAIVEKQFDKAEAALSRALDYASVSSDIPYLLATLKEARSARVAALQNVNLALEADRWNSYSANDANILKARLLICLMKYNEALGVIGRIKESEEKEVLHLQALLYSKQKNFFHVHAQRAIKLFPDSSQLLSLIFKYGASVKNLNEAELALISHALLISRAFWDGDLMWEAAPFISDIEDARRRLSAWIAGRGGSPLPHAALPVLLDLGVIDEEAALDALFAGAEGAGGSINKKDLENVYTLLRTEPSRQLFTNALSRYSGVIAEDKNGDGIYESICEYKNGFAIKYTNDKSQLGSYHIVMQFKAGEPSGVVVEIADGGDLAASINYDIYPSVKTAACRGRDYFFRMDDFFYAPVRFEYFPGDVLIFPEYESSDDSLSEKILTSFAYIIERGSREFAGAREQLKLIDGIIISSHETLDGVIISQTDYDNGRAVMQKVDTDLDGKMETLRFLEERSVSTSTGAALDERITEITHIKSDWDGDGTYE